LVPFYIRACLELQLWEFEMHVFTEDARKFG